MGTNYYVKNGKECGNCGGTGRADVHIGKSSAGWKFCFNPFKKSFKEWKEWLIGKTIFDEYDREVPFEKFINLVEDKQKRDSTHWDKDEDPKYYETLDAEGYRISRSEDFS